MIAPIVQSGMMMGAPAMGPMPYAVMRQPVTPHAAAVRPSALSFLPDGNAALNMANMGVMGLAIGVPVAGGAVGLVGKGAGKLGLSGTEAAIGRVADTIRMPHDLTFGPKAMTLSGLGRMTGTRGIGAALGETVADVAAGTAGVVSDLPGVGRMRGLTAERLSDAASRHWTRASKAVGGITEQMHASLGPEFTQAVAGIEQGLGHSAAAMNVTALQSSLEQAGKIANGAGNSAAVDAIGTIGKFAEKAADRYSMATTLHDLPGTIRKAPANIGKASVGNAAQNTLILGGTALSLYSTAKGIKGRMEALRELYADLTGKKADSVTLVNLFMEKVPQPVADARNHLLREFGPRLFLEAANAAFNASWILRGKDLGMVTFFALIAGGQVMDALAGESVLEYYKGFKDAQSRGEQIPPEYYQAFLGLASPELRKRGGVNSDFAKALAIEYASAQTSPKQIMQEVADGTMHNRFEELQKRYMAERSAHEKATAAIMQPQSHVEALAKRDDKDKAGYADRMRSARPELGKYTAEVAREAAAATPPTPGL